MLRIAWKGIVARKRRLVMTSLIIVVGVAFISGTAVLSDLLTRSVNDLVADAYQGIDVVVRSTEAEEHPMGVIATRRATPADQLDLVREVQGVRAAEGIVQFSPQMLDKEGERLASFGLPVFALNWLEDEDLASGNLIDGREPTDPDEAVLDFHTAEDLGFEIGDRLTLQFPTGAATPEIVGIGGLGTDGKDSTGARVVIMETSWLQELINQPSGYTDIRVAGDGSMSQDELATTIAAVLPPGSEAITGQGFIDENQESVGRLLDIIEQLVSAFGYLAAFVAAFVIYNIFSILIAQRTRQLALLRAVGASRSQIMGSVMLEAAVVGVLAAAIGLLAGFGLAVALKRVLGSILSLSEGLPRITLGAIVTSIVVGVLTTIVSALIPAIRATRVAPVAAMSEVGTETARIGWSRRIFGVLFVVGGVTLVLLGVRDAVGSPLAVIGAGSALLFVSLVVIGPLFAGPISRFIAGPLPALRGVSGRLARDNASRNPKRTTATGVALTIGVGVVTVIAVIAASFTASFRSSFENQLKGDLVIDSGGFGGGGFQPSLVDQVAAVDGVEVVTPLRFGPTRVLNSVAGLEAAARPAEEIAADPTGDSGVGATGPAGEEGFLIGIDPSTYFQLVDLGNVVPSEDAIVDGTVSMQDTVAEDNGWEIGDTVRLWSPEVGEREYPLAATYDQPFGPPGDAQFVVTSATFDEVSNTQFRVVNTLYAKSEPGTDLATVQKAIEEVVTPVAPVASVNDVGSFIDEQTEQLEAFLNIIYVLLLLAVIVAVFGISITMSMSVYERTRELGLLRAIGMERRQVRQAVRWEAAVISLFGTMLGLAMGVLLAMAFVSGFSDRGVGTTLPWATLVVIVIGGALAGLVAARRPAKRAAELDILDAIATV